MKDSVLNVWKIIGLCFKSKSNRILLKMLRLNHSINFFYMLHLNSDSSEGWIGIQFHTSFLLKTIKWMFDCIFICIYGVFRAMIRLLAREEFSYLVGRSNEFLSLVPWLRTLRSFYLTRQPVHWMLSRRRWFRTHWIESWWIEPPLLWLTACPP